MLFECMLTFSQPILGCFYCIKLCFEIIFQFIHRKKFHKTVKHRNAIHETIQGEDIEPRLECIREIRGSKNALLCREVRPIVNESI